MAENTKIEWATNTWNPWIGCTKVSPGCANCYAETLMDTRYGRVKWGKGNPRSRTSAANWKLPLRWNKDASFGLFRECPECGWRGVVKGEDARCKTNNCMRLADTMLQVRPRVFCASLADWLDDDVPIEWLADLLALIHATPNLNWLLLTKRPQNFQVRMLAAGMSLMGYVDGQRGSTPAALAEVPDSVIESVLGWSKRETFPSNVWIGTTVEDQQRANERIPELLKIPAKVRFLSCEPLLGPLDIVGALEGIDWVICGSESGPKRRTMEATWAVDLRQQCASAGVSFFMKQMDVDGKVTGSISAFPTELQERAVPV